MPSKGEPVKRRKLKLEKSLGLQEKAKALIPGVTQLLSKRPDRFSLGIWPGYFSKAKGVEVWDLDRNRYVDMSLGGIGANVLGYADPDVDLAVMKAIRKGTSSSLNCPEEIELAELLCELHPWAEMVRYARTGGEAMTIAVRIARAHTEKDKVAFCGYHGWHDWYLAANLGTENALGEHLISGLNPRGVPKGLKGTAIPFRYNRLDELQDIVASHGKDLGAIVMEPIRNQEPAPGFLEGVRALASETGAVWIIDEISAGFRLTTGGAHRVLTKACPDVAVFSKALGNGYPIAAVIGTSKVMSAAQTTFISSTNWTERIGPVAALATVRKHRDVDAAKHLVALGDRVQKGWLESAARHGLSVQVEGMKPMGHFNFGGDKAQSMKAYFIQLMLEQGFLASNLFYAMYAHTFDHVSRYLTASDLAFEQIAHALAQGDLEKRLLGKPSSVGFRRMT
jgi:glutamate-1-semialdehyde 2,1-aminomutase